MRKTHPLSFTARLLALLLIAVAGTALAQDQPFSINVSPLEKPESPVMDYAGVMDEATRARIAQKIIDFSESSDPRVEMGVAVIKTTGGRDIFDYSLAVARGWGIGSTEEDNPGLLLLVAVEDRKYFTQVSNDLGDELPDGLVGSLQRQYLVPAFRAGDYGKGIEDTIDAYIETVKAAQAGLPVTAPTPERVYERDYSFLSSGLVRFICCLAIVLFLIAMAYANKKGGGGGGGSSGGGSGFDGGDLLAAFLAGLISSGSSGGWSSGGSSSGWSSGGSSGWSGGGGWGGFGGGGSFGGGGAGGGW